MTGLLDLEILSIGESGRILEGPPGTKFTTQLTCFTSAKVGFVHPLYGRIGADTRRVLTLLAFLVREFKY